MTRSVPVRAWIDPLRIRGQGERVSLALILAPLVLSVATPRDPGPLPVAAMQRSAAAPAMLRGAATPARSSLDSILAAIRRAESDGCAQGGRWAVGDEGRAIGPYQIHRAYFQDAGVPGRYEDCRAREFARGVVLAYWQRWCPAALERCDAEVLARVHNGGPDGARKAHTLAYWRKVESLLR